jgi:hypothetical protein
MSDPENVARAMGANLKCKGSVQHCLPRSRGNIGLGTLAQFIQLGSSPI